MWRTMDNCTQMTKLVFDRQGKRNYPFGFSASLIARLERGWDRKMAITTSEKLWRYEGSSRGYWTLMFLSLPLHIQAQKSISVEQEKVFPSCRKSISRKLGFPFHPTFPTKNLAADKKHWVSNWEIGDCCKIKAHRNLISKREGIGVEV